MRRKTRDEMLRIAWAVADEHFALSGGERCPAAQQYNDDCPALQCQLPKGHTARCHQFSVFTPMRSPDLMPSDRTDWS